MATFGIDWWCFVFCFLFSILIGCCRSHDQMPTSHCFAWQWASVAVSMTHCNCLRKVLAFFDFSVYSYHFSDNHVISNESVACLHLLVLPSKSAISHMCFKQLPLWHAPIVNNMFILYSYGSLLSSCQ